MGQLPTKVKLVSCKTSCELLAEAAYYEARGEGDEGMLAVMAVIEARASHPSHRWPNTINKVLSQKCEFSYRCDGSMKKPKDGKLNKRALQLAHWYVNSGYNAGFVAQYYHKRGMSKRPKFSKTEKFVASVGNHDFYSCVSKYC